MRSSVSAQAVSSAAIAVMLESSHEAAIKILIFVIVFLN
jgi:hypothetical protein